MADDEQTSLQLTKNHVSDPITPSPTVLEGLLKIDSYQRFSGFDLSLLMEPEVAQKYLRSGSLIAISVSQIPGDDLFAIDGFGRIHLRLNKSTYESLGITGRPSKFGPPRQYYIVEINMRDPSMRAGQKAYDRFRHCLECFPGNPFSAWLAPQAIQQTRRWEVMMSYVNVNDSLEDVILPLDPLNTQSERCRSKIVDVQKPFPSPWSTPSRLESTSDLIELYEHLGASLLSTCDSYPSTDESPMTPIRTISARGFFHPISICQYARQLVISHGVCSLTSHISPLAPFSFLHRQQVTHPQPMAMKSQPAKRQKKGKGAMRGPERGIHAGPTSWTLICFPQEDITRTVVIQEDRQPKQETVDRLHKRGRGRESDEGDGSRDDEEGVENSEMVKRRWVLYESVGEDDTHC